MSEWQPIETAPKDGTFIYGRSPYRDRFGALRYRQRNTFWGKTSHVPLYGWNFGLDVENLNLWEPTTWRPITRSRKRRQRNLVWLRSHFNYEGDDCLLWPGVIDKEKGYGKVGYKRKILWAYRLMCEFAHGPAPADKPQASHSCGNGPEGCCNPRHLSWATQSENQLDRRRHGTAVTWRGGHRSQLTAAQVAEIRALKGKEILSSLARRFGISMSNVRRWQSTTHEPFRPRQP